MNDAPKRSGPLSGVGPIGRTPPPRRFYKKATVGSHEAGGFVLLLDGRVGKTPAGKPLSVPSEAVASAVAAEWDAQDGRIDPASMPLTRLVNSAIDGVAGQMDAVRADIVRHAESDLLCYRADGPEGLVAQQEAMWSPLLDYARAALGARFVLAEGVMHVAQDQATLTALDKALQDDDFLALAAIHTVTTLTGSAVIALAVARGTITPEAAWNAAHVDEDWQMSQWGQDTPALERRAFRWREMEAAGAILAAVTSR